MARHAAHCSLCRDGFHSVWCLTSHLAAACLHGLVFPAVQPLSPLQEVPDSPAAAAAALLEEEQQQRGGMFSRLLSQLFDQSTWQQDPTWHHGTAGAPFLLRSHACNVQHATLLHFVRRHASNSSLFAAVNFRAAEFDVVGSATELASVASPHGTVRAHSIQTTAISAHPSKQL